MLRRLSVLGSILLAACVPATGPGAKDTAACYDKVPSKAEAMEWRSAQRVNTAKSYRKFISLYPRSCYVPMATAKLSKFVDKKAPPVRNLPKPDKESGAGSSY